MNLTSIIRKLESQLKNAEGLARRYDAQAGVLRDKLSVVARALGKAAFGKDPVKRKKRRMSAAARAKIAAAQRKRWAKVRAEKKAK